MLSMLMILAWWLVWLGLVVFSPELPGWAWWVGVPACFGLWAGAFVPLVMAQRRAGRALEAELERLQRAMDEPRRTTVRARTGFLRGSDRASDVSATPDA